MTNPDNHERICHELRHERARNDGRHDLTPKRVRIGRALAVSSGKVPWQVRYQGRGAKV